LKLKYGTEQSRKMGVRGKQEDRSMADPTPACLSERVTDRLEREGAPRIRRAETKQGQDHITVETKKGKREKPNAQAQKVAQKKTQQIGHEVVKVYRSPKDQAVNGRKGERMG